MTFVALVRHGETDWNFYRRLQGSSDIPLNELGRAQAREAAAELAGSSWDLLVSSPLSRASETADIIGARIGLQRSHDHTDLAERHFGEAEGMTDYEAYSRWPSGRYPGMERRSDLIARTRGRLDSIAGEYPGSAVVVVAHGGVIRAILDSIIGRSSPRIVNAGISTLTNDSGSWEVRTVNSLPLERYQWWM